MTTNDTVTKMRLATTSWCPHPSNENRGVDVQRGQAKKRVTRRERSVRGSDDDEYVIYKETFGLMNRKLTCRSSLFGMLERDTTISAVESMAQPARVKISIRKCRWVNPADTKFFTTKS